MRVIFSHNPIDIVLNILGLSAMGVVLARCIYLRRRAYRDTWTANSDDYFYTYTKLSEPIAFRRKEDGE